MFLREFYRSFRRSLAKLLRTPLIRHPRVTVVQFFRRIIGLDEIPHRPISLEYSPSIDTLSERNKVFLERQQVLYSELFPLKEERK